MQVVEDEVLRTVVELPNVGEEGVSSDPRYMYVRWRVSGYEDAGGG